MNSALQSYLDGYRSLPAAPAWLKPLQEAALDRAEARGFPGARDEAWKYTSVALLAKRGFKPAFPPVRLDADVLSTLLIPGLDASRAVFVNGRYDPALSRLPEGVRLVSLASAEAGIKGSLDLHPDWEHDTFVNLNTALFRDGLLLELAPGQILDQPLELLHVSLPEDDATAHNLRFVIRLGAGAQASLIERYTHQGASKQFNNVVTQVNLAERAKLSHVRLQAESTQAFHVARVLVRQAAGSEYRSHNLHIGGTWTRLDLHTRLEAESASAYLDGLYAVTGRQHVDNHTRVDHLVPHTMSKELYRGILDGQGRAVFNGKVVVAPHALKTDAEQANHNLILSRGAEVDTKPELEIYADDVKCSHGATIGQLDEQQLFYLRSRGLDEASARSLLISAFAERLLTAIPQPALAAYVRQLLAKSISAIKSEA
ncbi:MAG TPA: Fe-S cluster assembly protein SufD [Gammaproteobacteria bacterium]|nr:Fe-S cluster assembly protein SufD [Gammaproteobacteria bacterium]